MTPSLKRPLREATRSISPPALKRKLIIPPPSPSPPPPTISDNATLKKTPLGSVTDSTSKKVRDELTIFSWNVNGVGPFIQKRLTFNQAAASPLRDFLQRHSWPHFLCLQEVKISRQDEKTQYLLEKAANDSAKPGEHTYTILYSLPRDKFNGVGFGGKVYGVASLVRNDIAPSIRTTIKPDWDLEGRVLIHEMMDDLVVINGYWVNGTTNPYRDPKTGKVTGTRHGHKLQFHRHMRDECLRWESQGKNVILVGDMNVARERIDGHPNLRTSPSQHVVNRHDFNQKFFTAADGLQGVDVFRHLHGDKRKYTYYPRNCNWGASCDRVDLIIVSKKLLDIPSLTLRSDVCDNPVDRGHSDHVPLWISLTGSSKT